MAVSLFYFCTKLSVYTSVRRSHSLDRIRGHIDYIFHVNFYVKSITILRGRMLFFSSSPVSSTRLTFGRIENQPVESTELFLFSLVSLVAIASAGQFFFLSSLYLLRDFFLSVSLFQSARGCGCHFTVHTMHFKMPYNWNVCRWIRSTLELLYFLPIIIRIISFRFQFKHCLVFNSTFAHLLPTRRAM